MGDDEIQDDFDVIPQCTFLGLSDKNPKKMLYWYVCSCDPLNQVTICPDCKENCHNCENLMEVEENEFIVYNCYCREVKHKFPITTIGKLAKTECNYNDILNLYPQLYEYFDEENNRICRYCAYKCNTKPAKKIKARKANIQDKQCLCTKDEHFLLKTFDMTGIFKYVINFNFSVVEKIPLVRNLVYRQLENYDGKQTKSLFFYSLFVYKDSLEMEFEKYHFLKEVFKGVNFHTVMDLMYVSNENYNQKICCQICITRYFMIIKVFSQINKCLFGYISNDILASYSQNERDYYFKEYIQKNTSEQGKSEIKDFERMIPYMIQYFEKFYHFNLNNNDHVWGEDFHKIIYDMIVLKIMKRDSRLKYFAYLGRVMNEKYEWYDRMDASFPYICKIIYFCLVEAYSRYHRFDDDDDTEEIEEISAIYKIILLIPYNNTYDKEMIKIFHLIATNSMYFSEKEKLCYVNTISNEEEELFEGILNLNKNYFNGDFEYKEYLTNFERIINNLIDLYQIDFRNVFEKNFDTFFESNISKILKIQKLCSEKNFYSKLEEFLNVIKNLADFFDFKRKHYDIISIETKNKLLAFILCSIYQCKQNFVIFQNVNTYNFQYYFFDYLNETIVFNKKLFKNIELYLNQNGHTNKFLEDYITNIYSNYKRKKTNPRQLTILFKDIKKNFVKLSKSYGPIALYTRSISMIIYKKEFDLIKSNKILGLSSSYESPEDEKIALGNFAKFLEFIVNIGLSGAFYSTNYFNIENINSLKNQVEEFYLSNRNNSIEFETSCIKFLSFFVNNTKIIDNLQFKPENTLETIKHNILYTNPFLIKKSVKTEDNQNEKTFLKFSKKFQESFKNLIEVQDLKDAETQEYIMFGLIDSWKFTLNIYNRNQYLEGEEIVLLKDIFKKFILNLIFYIELNKEIPSRISLLGYLNDCNKQIDDLKPFEISKIATLNDSLFIHILNSEFYKEINSILKVTNKDQTIFCHKSRKLIILFEEKLVKGKSRQSIIHTFIKSFYKNIQNDLYDEWYQYEVRQVDILSLTYSNISDTKNLCSLNFLLQEIIREGNIIRKIRDEYESNKYFATRIKSFIYQMFIFEYLGKFLFFYEKRDFFNTLEGMNRLKFDILNSITFLSLMTFHNEYICNILLNHEYNSDIINFHYYDKVCKERKCQNSQSLNIFDLLFFILYLVAKQITLYQNHDCSYLIMIFKKTIFLILNLMRESNKDNFQYFNKTPGLGSFSYLDYFNEIPAIIETIDVCQNNNLLEVLNGSFKLINELFFLSDEEEKENNLITNINSIFNTNNMYRYVRKFFKTMILKCEGSDISAEKVDKLVIVEKSMKKVWLNISENNLMRDNLMRIILKLMIYINGINDRFNDDDTNLILRKKLPSVDDDEQENKPKEELPIDEQEDIILIEFFKKIIKTCEFMIYVKVTDNKQESTVKPLYEIVNENEEHQQDDENAEEESESESEEANKSLMKKYVEKKENQEEEEIRVQIEDQNNNLIDLNDEVKNEGEDIEEGDNKEQEIKPNPEEINQDDQNEDSNQESEEKISGENLLNNEVEIQQNPEINEIQNEGDQNNVNNEDIEAIVNEAGNNTNDEINQNADQQVNENSSGENINLENPQENQEINNENNDLNPPQSGEVQENVVNENAPGDNQVVEDQNQENLKVDNNEEQNENKEIVENKPDENQPPKFLDLKINNSIDSKKWVSKPKLKKVYCVLTPQVFQLDKKKITEHVMNLDLKGETDFSSALLEYIPKLKERLNITNSFLKKRNKLIKYCYSIDYSFISQVNIMITTCLIIILLLFMNEDNLNNTYLLSMISNVNYFEIVFNLVFITAYILSHYQINVEYDLIEEKLLDDDKSSGFSLQKIKAYFDLYIVDNLILNEDICFLILNVFISIMLIIYPHLFGLLCIQLFTIVKFVPTIKEIFIAFKMKMSQLIDMVIFLLIIIILYSYYAFFFIEKYYFIMNDTNQLQNECENIILCLMFHFNEGVRAGGGIGDSLEIADFSLFDIPSILKYIGDLIFFIFVILLILNMVNGLIITTFSQLREEKENKKQQMNEKCILCNISIDEFEKRNLKIEHHWENVHNFYNCIYYLLNLNFIDLYTLSEDQFQIKLYTDEGLMSFLPYNRTLDIMNGEKINSKN